MDVNELLTRFDLPPLKWSSKEVSKWLDYLNMGEYKDAFEKNKVDGLNILDIEDDEIENYIGIKNSIHRKRVRNGINILRNMQKEFYAQNRSMIHKTYVEEGNFMVKQDDKEFKENFLNESMGKASASISAKKVYNRNMESRKTNMQTVLKKSIDQPFEDNMSIYGYGQNIQNNTKFEEDPLALTSNDRRALEAVFDNIIEEGKVDNNNNNNISGGGYKYQRQYTQQLDEKKANVNSSLKPQKYLNSPFLDALPDKENIIYKPDHNYMNPLLHQNREYLLDSSFDLLNLQDDQNNKSQQQQHQHHYHHHKESNSNYNHRSSLSHANAANTPNLLPGYNLRENNNNEPSLVFGQGNENLGQQQQQPSPITNPNISGNNLLINKPCELIIQPVDGLQSNNFYCINENGGKIGRHSNNEIVIFEESVSRHHAAIEFKNDKFWVLDIGSTTGTFIKLTSIIVLEAGMMIELGSNQFLVEKIHVENEEKGILTLKIIEGIQPGREFIIQNTASIGRKGPQNTIAFADDFHLSNSHAKIDFNDGRFVFEDLGSTNGSWMRLSPQGIKSKPFELSDGVIFKIGAISTFKVKKSATSYTDLTNQKQIEATNTCAICYEAEKDTVFLPCKHNVTCIRCSKNVKACPICRVKIKEMIRIYKS